MEQQELVAEFMGFKLKSRKGLKYKYWEKETAEGREVLGSEGELKYNKSWDWQIPAWAKLVVICQGLVSSTRSIEGFKTMRDKYYRLLDKYEQAVCANSPEIGLKVFIETLTWYKNNL